jgi:hypothetical protein
MAHRGGKPSQYQPLSGVTKSRGEGKSTKNARKRGASGHKLLKPSNLMVLISTSLSLSGGLFGGFDGQDLATVVGAAAWAGDVSWFGSSTIAAGRELGRTPPVRELAEFLLHFGFAALWNGHGVIRLTVAAGIFRGWSGSLKF